MGYSSSSQIVGVTATLPHIVHLPYSLSLTDGGSDEWFYFGKRLYHNHSYTEFPNIPSLDDLSVHQKIGLLISTNGQLHVFSDKQHMECVATGLPVNTPLWGVVDFRFKSEMLSGELDNYVTDCDCIMYRCIICDYWASGSKPTYSGQYCLNFVYIYYISVVCRSDARTH